MACEYYVRNRIKFYLRYFGDWLRTLIAQSFICFALWFIRLKQYGGVNLFSGFATAKVLKHYEHYVRIMFGRYEKYD